MLHCNCIETNDESNWRHKVYSLTPLFFVRLFYFLLRLFFLSRFGWYGGTTILWCVCAFYARINDVFTSINQRWSLGWIDGNRVVVCVRACKHHKNCVWQHKFSKQSDEIIFHLNFTHTELMHLFLTLSRSKSLLAPIRRKTYYSYVVRVCINETMT